MPTHILVTSPKEQLLCAVIAVHCQGQRLEQIIIPNTKCGEKKEGKKKELKRMDKKRSKEGEEAKTATSEPHIICVTRYKHAETKWNKKNV